MENMKMNNEKEDKSPVFMIEGGIDISPLLSAYSQFHEALQITKSDLEKAGTIQYFEFTYELAWKTMKRVLNYRGKDLNSPRPVLREAALEKLIEDPEVWFDFTKDRNETVRTYNKSVANSIFQDLHLFDIEMKKLIQVLKNLQ
jgi:nucleotidyltransferase substrate binding protein (TIGR01987 family)